MPGSFLAFATISMNEFAMSSSCNLSAKACHVRVFICVDFCHTLFVSSSVTLLIYSGRVRESEAQGAQNRERGAHACKIKKQGKKKKGIAP